MPVDIAWYIIGLVASLANLAIMTWNSYANRKDKLLSSKPPTRWYEITNRGEFVGWAIVAFIPALNLLSGVCVLIGIFTADWAKRPLFTFGEWVKAPLFNENEKQ